MSKKTVKKRILALIFATSMLALCCTAFSGCSKPPEYSEIEERFIELVEASYGINKVLFGEGLTTYERVYYRTADSYKIYNGEYYYYEIDDEELGRIFAFRTVKPQRTEDENGTPILITAFSYALETAEPIDGEEPLYTDVEAGLYYYKLDYTERTYDFYYSESDPEDYDYVISNADYGSIDMIKEAAERVYSRDYLETSVYEALFTGVVVSNNESDAASMTARYMEYMDVESASTEVHLMKSNKYEPLVTATRIFDFSTAVIVKPSNKKLVNVEVETYLENSPENRETVRVTLLLQDGEWYLDSGTY